MKNIIFLISIILIVISCNKKEKADLIIHNAQIYTVDSLFSVAQSFAVKDGKFVACGDNKEILLNYDSDNIIDLKGKYIYPGFIDAHCHFYGYGLGLLKVADLRGTESFENVLEAIKIHHKKYDFELIEGRGWDQNDWPVKEFPDKAALDSLFPDNPVVLIRIDGHAALANSIALEKAGITKETKIAGGEILLKNGELSGILLDNAVESLKNVIPDENLLMKRNGLSEAQKNCFSVGLTTVADAGLDKEIILLIDSMQKTGSLKMRIYAMLNPTSENIDYFIKKGPQKNDMLNIRSIKLYADGALGSRGGLMIEAYSDAPNTKGISIETVGYYKKYCKIAIENGFQVNTHAIGDSAVRLMLNIYGEFLKNNNDLRWRIEHAQIVNQEDFMLFKKYSIIPSVQTTHASSDMYWAEKRIGKERMTGAYAYKKLLEQNGWLCNGTDFPIEKINPIYSFYAAVVRKDLKGWPENGFQMENALTKQQALKAMTIWAAKACFEENDKGSIEVGKFADFIVLDRDIMKCGEKEIPDTKVLKTFIGGKIVYDLEN